MTKDEVLKEIEELITKISTDAHGNPTHQYTVIVEILKDLVQRAQKCQDELEELQNIDLDGC